MVKVRQAPSLAARYFRQPRPKTKRRSTCMKDPQESCQSTPLYLENSSDACDKQSQEKPAGTSRRSFLGKVGGATAVALTVGIPLEPLLEGKKGQAEASVVHYGSGARAYASFDYREDTAEANNIDVGELPDNGDLQRFSDYSGNWSKCLKHDALGIPNYASYQSLLHALRTGRFSDFE